MNTPKKKTLVLPLPPSVNSYWAQGKTYAGKRNSRKSDRALKFMEYGLAAVRMQGSPSFGAYPVVVSIMLHTRPRGGDLDNFNKGILDLLTHAGVWDDDDQIVDLRVIRRGSVKGGAAVVSIRAATDKEMERTTIIEKMVGKLKDWGLA